MLNSGSSNNNNEEIIEEEINRISIKNSTKNLKEDLEKPLRDDKMNKQEEKGNNARFLVDGAVIGRIQQKFNNKINERNRSEELNTGSLFYSKPKLLNNGNLNNNILLRKLFRLRTLNNRKTTSTPRLLPFPVKKRQQNGQRLVPVRMQINTRQKQIGRRIKIPLKYTNSTKEIIPSIQNNLNWSDIDEFFTDSITSSTTDNSPLNQQNNLKEKLNWQRRGGHNRRELGIKKLIKNGNIEGNLLEEEGMNEKLLENKVKQQHKEIPTSIGGGGSFAQEEFENPVKQQNGVSLLQMPFNQKENIETSPLVRAPKFNVVPLNNNSPIKKAGNRRDGWVHIDGVSEIIVDNSRLDGLLECCQEQSFGCRPLCTRNVSKEQIKQAMSSGRCPPLSLTNVIKCFPRFYNITSVGQCCASSSLINSNSNLPINSFLQIKREIPPHCLSLCSPNFHLSLAHLACIEFVENILGCYRQLLEKENGWNKRGKNGGKGNLLNYYRIFNTNNY
uniref:Uncharacterized protein n=2 Tax=Meloidogyne enterolobii TaxID=390850 RepID=A0A6V7VW37_MELEN|nr:unnamed protein product [Meloidogyne enterolobii]